MVRLPPTPFQNWDDRQLVSACLDGEEGAWRALVDKYQRLVYRVVTRGGIFDDEAADLFQTIWLEAYSDLSKLQKRESFKAWLVSVAHNKVYHFKRKRRQRALREGVELDDSGIHLDPALPADFVEELMLEQLVREAVGRQSERCQELILQLFFAPSPLSYKALAEHLGLAVGSIGFIRGRCLEKLRDTLDEMGVEPEDVLP
ncbi:MAG: sigma-70 family RNA polymerase sigma factor [Acidobacteriota bacterium]